MVRSRAIVAGVALALAVVGCSSGARSYTTDAEALEVRLTFVNQTGRATLSVADYRAIADRVCATDPGVASDYRDVIEDYDLNRNLTEGDRRFEVWMMTRAACPERGHVQPESVSTEVDVRPGRVRSDDPPLGFPGFPSLEPTLDALGYTTGERWSSFGTATVSAAEAVAYFDREASAAGWVTEVFGPADHLGGQFWSVDLAIDGFEGAIEVLEAAVDGQTQVSVLIAIAPR